MPRLPEYMPVSRWSIRVSSADGERKERAAPSAPSLGGFMRRLIQGSFIFLLLLLFASLLMGRQDLQPEPVGREMCLACHDLGPVFDRTPHAEKECEECHGAGSLHVESGGDDSLAFENKKGDWVAGRCLGCHDLESNVSSFQRTPHGLNDVSCVSCHRAHPETFNFGLLKERMSELCLDCHGANRVDFQKPFHHPVLEGAIKCTDCHSPHSADKRPLLQLTQGPGDRCVTCHADKKGPFVFEHAPLKVNDCQTCHQPHGSVNTRMLVRSQVRQLCLDCHSMSVSVAGSQPPAFHDIRSSRFQNCTVCHRAVHGSNVSPMLLR